MSRTRKRQRAKKQTFTSKADTFELRHYQRLASQYPPLPHEELLSMSRRFIKGRNARISFEEHDLVDLVLDSDWDESNIRSHKNGVIAAYKAKIAWLSMSKTPDELVYDMLPSGQHTPAGLHAHRLDNVLSEYVWEEPMSLADVMPECRDVGLEQFLPMESAAISRLLDALKARMPEVAAPKDVIDRWSERLAQLETRYMASVLSLVKTDAEKRQMKVWVRDSERALAAIVNHNMQLAMSRVSRVMKSNQRAQQIGVYDLIATANLGLVLGARQFDPEMGRKFSTYAAYHIDGQLYNLLKREDGKCGIKGFTAHEQKQLSTIITIKVTFKRLLGREPTMAELRSLTRITPDIINKRLSTPQVHTQNIYAPAGRSGKNGEDAPALVDVLKSEHSIESELVQDEYTELVELLKREIVKLPDGQREVLMMVTGIAPDDMSEEIPEPVSIKRAASKCRIPIKKAEEYYAQALVTLRENIISQYARDNGLSLATPEQQMYGDQILMGAGGETGGWSDFADEDELRRMQAKKNEIARMFGEILDEAHGE